MQFIDDIFGIIMSLLLYGPKCFLTSTVLPGGPLALAPLLGHVHLPGLQSTKVRLFIKRVLNGLLGRIACCPFGMTSG